MFRLLAVTLLLAPLSCGASTELDDRPIPRSRPTQKPTPVAAPNPDPATPTPAKPGGTGNGNAPIGTDNPLGECTLGPEPKGGRSCPYIAENRCYPDPNSACACICPRNGGDTTCAEGFFPDDNGAIVVNCFSL